MKLLILTQKVDKNDAVLGFFHAWLLKFAEKFEYITVICLQLGSYELPHNVRILSLGKEDGFSKLKYIFRFYKYIWKYRRDYDAIFVHMNPEYILLGGILWRLWHKKIALWYVHGLVDLKLRIAERISNIIFSAIKESFRLKSKKIKIVGHGIDCEVFKDVNNFYVKNKTFRIISIGRISPVKDYETLVRAIDKFRKHTENFRVEIIGGIGLEKQEEYLEDIKKLVRSLRLDDFIFFIGPVPNTDIVKYLEAADLFVNMSKTGGLDKAVLEALAAGVPVVTCNEPALKAIAKYTNIDDIAFPTGDYLALCNKIIFWENIDLNKRQSIVSEMRQVVKNDHSLDTLIDKIKNFYTI